MAENNSKDIVTRNSGLPQMVDASEYGINLEPEDVVMPRLSLLQPSSLVDGQGKFHFSLTGELFDSVDCVVFSNARGKVMFDPDMSKMMSICGSDDRVTPSPRFDRPKAPECVKCAFNSRNYSEKVIVGGKEVSMYCSDTQTLRCMFIDSLYPFLFVGRRSSILAVNDFLSIMKFETVKYKKPLYCFPIRLTSKIAPNKPNKYFIPVIEKLPMIEREEFATMMNKYGNYDINKTYEAEEKMGKPNVESEDGVPF